jgi:hypothetical protein
MSRHALPVEMKESSLGDYRTLLRTCDGEPRDSRLEFPPEDGGRTEAETQHSAAGPEYDEVDKATIDRSPARQCT